MCCKCFFCCCTGCLGKTFLVIFSILLIALGIFILYASSLFTNNSIILVLFSSQFRAVIKGCFVALGICSIAFGILGIIGIILKNCKCYCGAKVFLLIYSILSILLFIAVVIIFFSATVIMYGLVDFEKYFCQDSSIAIINVYNRIISSNNQPSTCPTICPSSASSSKKIADCNYYLDLFDVHSSYYDDNFFTNLDTFEGNYECTGICSKHSAVLCTYFNNMSKKSSGTCVESIKNIAKRNWTILLIAMIISFIIILFNLWSGFGILCCSDDNQVDDGKQEEQNKRKDEKKKGKKNKQHNSEDEETARKNRKIESDSD